MHENRFSRGVQRASEENGIARYCSPERRSRDAHTPFGMSGIIQSEAKREKRRGDVEVARSTRIIEMQYDVEWNASRRYRIKRTNLSFLIKVAPHLS